MKSTKQAMHSKFRMEVTKVRNSLPAPLSFKGNIGLAYVTIKGVPRKLKAHSSINNKNDIRSNIRGFIYLNPRRQFQTSKVPLGLTGVLLDRKYDTEAKILEYVAAYLGNNRLRVGNIYLYTEKRPCISCLSVIKQFKEKYPTIQIKVFWDRE